MDILKVNNLHVQFKTLEGMVDAVNDISLTVAPKEIVGIIGESGSGKSQTVLAIMGLLPKNAIINGSARFLGNEILGIRPKQLNQIRGAKIAMIFQDPMTSLNPYLTIQSQMVEVLVTHKNMSYSNALKEAILMLDFVKIRDAKNSIKSYPHELSGGMRQRVMIAMALLCKPELIIADEPTTALDVTVQAQILQILKDLCVEFNTSIILITHDMGLVASMCDYVNVMHNGKFIEHNCVNKIFFEPQNPYTRKLLQYTQRQ